MTRQLYRTMFEKGELLMSKLVDGAVVIDQAERNDLADAIQSRTTRELREFYDGLTQGQREKFIWVVSQVCGPDSVILVLNITTIAVMRDRIEAEAEAALMRERQAHLQTKATLAEAEGRNADMERDLKTAMVVARTDARYIGDLKSRIIDLEAQVAELTPIVEAVKTLKMFLA